MYKIGKPSYSGGRAKTEKAGNMGATKRIAAEGYAGRALRQIFLILLLGAASARAAVDIVELYHPGSGLWLNSPLTPGYSMLDRGGWGTYQLTWDQLPQFRANPTKQLAGNIVIPVLLADWRDFNPLTDDAIANDPGVQNFPGYVKKTVQQISSELNSAQGLAGYFYEISGGALNVTFKVYPWIDSGNSSYLKNRAEYLTFDQNRNWWTSDDVRFIKDTIRSAVADIGVDFTRFDADKNRVVDGLIVMYEGRRGAVGDASLNALNAQVSEEQTFFLDNISSYVADSDPNKPKFSSQNILINRVSVFDEYASLATQAHELGHLLLGYADNYHSSETTNLYTTLGDYGLSANHGSPIPFHAAAVEKFLFGNWIIPMQATYRDAVYSLDSHHLSRARIVQGAKYSRSNALQIPINGNPDHFLVIENRNFLPPAQGGSYFNDDQHGTPAIESGVIISEVDRRQSYFTNGQFKRWFPPRIQNGPVPQYPARMGAWVTGDRYVFSEGGFSVDVEVTSAPSEVVMVRVRNLNAPRITPVAPQTVLVGSTLKVSLTATDPDGDVLLNFIVSGLPAGAVFDGKRNRIVWTPTADQKGMTYTPQVFVTDSTGLIDTAWIRISAL